VNNTTEKLQQLLQDEKMADAIKMFVNMLNGTNQKENTQKDNTKNTVSSAQNQIQPVTQPVQQPVPANQPLTMGNMNSQIDTMMKIQQVYTKLTSNDDPTINLLMALKPHLNSKRAPILDNAIQVVRISKLPRILQELNNQ